MSEISICVKSVRDSMGCYWGGIGRIDGDVAAIASADNAKDCWDQTWEVLSYEMECRARPSDREEGKK